MTDLGIIAAKGLQIELPLPPSWMGLPTAPTVPPAWATIGNLSSTQVRALQAQIGYISSSWNYGLISNTGNLLGRYQFSPQTLENYGLLAAGSNSAYGSTCVNYVHCWRPMFVNNGQNAYQNYFYNVNSLQQFLTNTAAQEHLAYQLMSDLYTGCYRIGAILDSDTPDIVAGMIAVAWFTGVGTGPTVGSANGSGSYSWRFSNIGAPPIPNIYNAGRYAVQVLSQ
jgi:hypothetical protein